MRAAVRHARRRLRALESRGPDVRKRVEITAGQGGQRPVERAKGREAERGANRCFVTTTSGFDNPTRAAPRKRESNRTLIL